jgi:hypothetical protein
MKYRFLRLKTSKKLKFRYLGLSFRVISPVKMLKNQP